MLLGGLVLWGIGDVLVPSNDKVIAKIGNNKIYSSEIERQVSQEMMRFQAQGINEEALEEFRKVLMGSFLNQEINNSLMALKAENMGIEINGKQMLKTEYLENSSVSTEQLKRMFRSQGGEKYFLNKLMKEKKVDYIESIFSSIPIIDNETIEILHKLQKQTRDVTVLKLGVDGYKKVKAPSEEELKAYYETNKNSLYAPEYREVVYAEISKNIFGEGELKDKDDNEIYDLVYETSGIFLDRLASGMTIEEAANEVGANIKSIKEVDARGLNPDNKVSENIPNIPDFLNEIFRLEEGRSTDILESNNGDVYVIARLDRIIPERIKEFDEVKKELVTNWKKENILENNLLKAEAIKKDIESGKKLEEIIKKNNLETVRLDNINRTFNQLPTETVDEIFKLEIGGATNTVKDERNNLIIAVLENVNEAKETDPFEVLETKDEQEKQIFNETMFLFLEKLREDYKVKNYL
jgi:peptidyl-prolyl cis-trans isomerase D